MGDKRETAESAENEKKPKRPVTPGFEFVNITHPDQSKQKAVLTTVRKVAMNHHLYQNSSPDLDEKDRVSRLPRRLRSNLGRGIGSPLSDSGSPRAASVPKESDTSPLLTPGHDQERLRRVSADVFSRQSTPQRKRSRSEDEPQENNPPNFTRPQTEKVYSVRQSSDMQEHLQKIKRNCDHSFGSEDLDRLWRARGAQDRMFYLSSLCVSARHTEALNGTRADQNTLALDTEVVRSINEKLKNPQEQTADNTIAAALHIAICYNYCDPGRVDWYNLICTLVELRGGLDKLDSFPFLSSAVLINGLASAIFQEASPHPMFLSAAFKIPRTTPHKLESPICCSSAGFNQLANSVRCSEQLLALLRAIHHAIDVVATADATPTARQQQYQAQRMDVRSQLLTFRQISGQGLGGGGGSHRDDVYVYESCRVAAIVLERALHYSITLSQAIKDRPLLHNLRDALVQTDLESCWGDMAGVLLWAAYIGAAACNGIEDSVAAGEEDGREEARQLRAWFVGCATRVTIKTAYTGSGEIVRALYTLSRIQEVLALPKYLSPG